MFTEVIVSCCFSQRAMRSDPNNSSSHPVYRRTDSQRAAITLIAFVELSIYAFLIAHSVSTDFWQKHTWIAIGIITGVVVTTLILFARRYLCSPKEQNLGQPGIVHAAFPRQSGQPGIVHATLPRQSEFLHSICIAQSGDWEKWYNPFEKREHYFHIISGRVMTDEPSDWVEPILPKLTLTGFSDELILSDAQFIGSSNDWLVYYNTRDKEEMFVKRSGPELDLRWMVPPDWNPSGYTLDR